MYRFALHTAVSFCILFLLAGCSSKNEPEYEKPAIYWYKKMMQSVATGNLEKADDYFLSLDSEHVGSSLIPVAMEILIQAHMDANEYLLANFYIDQYIKRYSTPKNRDFLEFMKIKAAFMGLKSPQRDQELIEHTLNKSKEYIKYFKNSEFTPMVQTIEVRLEMTKYIMNEKIAALYERRGKERAARIYRERNDNSWIVKSEIGMSPKSWIERIFE